MPLFIHGTAMKASSFIFQPLTAIATTVFILDATAYPLHKDQDEKSQKEVANINVGSQDKEEITKDTAGHESQ